MFKRILISGAALAALTACGGGGGGGGDVDLGGGDGSFGDLVSETARLGDLLENEFTVVSPSELSSDLEFNGIVLLADDFRAADPGTTAYVGQVRLTADVSEETISGTGFNFFINNIASNGLPGSPAFSREGEMTIFANYAGGEDFEVTIGGNLEVGGTGNDGTLSNISGVIDGNFFTLGTTSVDAFAAQGTEASGNDLSIEGSEDTLDISMVAD